jgi:transglutaminase-like putative cysteine protease
MRINIDLNMDYQLTGDEAVLLTIEASQTEEQSVIESSLEIESASLYRIGGEGGLGQRVWAHVAGDRLKLRYRAKAYVSRSIVQLESLAASPMHTLPSEVLTYLRASRFCPSDLFTTFVAQQFGHLVAGAKITAIKDWVAAEIAYVPGSSNAETTAIDTFVVREGVCRDFAHLVCTLARASNIPARYTSVYGVDVSPPDFHAVAQVWLEGAWYFVDATGMSTADGLVVIGAGRDAGDVAFMETQKWAYPISQTVWVSRD